MEGKSCSRLLAQQKVAQNVKSCSKVAEHNLFVPNVRHIGRYVGFFKIFILRKMEENFTEISRKNMCLQPQIGK